MTEIKKSSETNPENEIQQPDNTITNSQTQTNLETSINRQPSLADYLQLIEKDAKETIKKTIEVAENRLKVGNDDYSKEARALSSAEIMTSKNLLNETQTPRLAEVLQKTNHFPAIATALVDSLGRGEKLTGLKLIQTVQAKLATVIRLTESLTSNFDTASDLKGQDNTILTFEDIRKKFIHGEDVCELFTTIGAGMIDLKQFEQNPSVDQNDNIVTLRNTLKRIINSDDIKPLTAQIIPIEIALKNIDAYAVGHLGDTINSLSETKEFHYLLKELSLEHERLSRFHQIREYWWRIRLLFGGLKNQFSQVNLGPSQNLDSDQLRQLGQQLASVLHSFVSDIYNELQGFVATLEAHFFQVSRGKKTQMLPADIEGLKTKLQNGLISLNQFKPYFQEIIEVLSKIEQLEKTGN